MVFVKKKRDRGGIPASTGIPIPFVIPLHTVSRKLFIGNSYQKEEKLYEYRGDGRRLLQISLCVSLKPCILAG